MDVARRPSQIPGEALIRQYSYLARRTAQAHMGKLARNNGLDFDDLVGAAHHGLCRAARDFDPSRGILFTTFAITLMRGAIAEMLRTWDPVPRSMRDKEKAGLIIIPANIELDAPVWEDSVRDRVRSEMLIDPEPGPEAAALANCDRTEIAAAIDRLPEREREVIERYFWQTQTLRVIGEEMGVSESRAFQMRARAIERLKLALANVV